MRSPRWAHVAAVAVIAAAAVAVAAPAKKAPARTPASGSGSGSASGSGSGSGSASAAKAAVEPPVEHTNADIPPIPAVAPAKFIVAPFENHSDVKTLDWLVAGAPFEIAEKTEGVLGLDAIGAPLFVGAPIGPTANATGAWAGPTGARWAITGYFERPNWQLSLHVRLWKIIGTSAIDTADAARTADPATYHQMIADILGELWTKVGVTVTPAQQAQLARPLAPDLYGVTLMGRGLGHLSGALGEVDLKAAEHDLDRATFIAPTLYEAQRLAGELYLAQAPNDPKAIAKANGKFNYAHDLAPDDIASLRASAYAAAAGNNHDVALSLFRELVIRRPWDLDARYHLGAALWATGDATTARAQLEQVTAKAPDMLPARRVLALIHASRSDTRDLVTQLEEIARRAPADLEVKADLATAYGALGAWDKAIAQLTQIAAAHPADVALAMRLGDAERRAGALDRALEQYARAAKLAPESTWPAFITAQALFDAGRLPDAQRVYTQLLKAKDDAAAAAHALGVIALAQGRVDDAAPLLRRASRELPRDVIARRAVIIAELARKDSDAATAQLEPALAAWPRDGELHYLAGIAHALAGDRVGARAELVIAVADEPGLAAARAALGAVDAGGTATLALAPGLIRPWGDADALTIALDRYATTAAAMSAARIHYQHEVLTMLGAVGKGPLATGKGITTCVLARLAPPWAAAQDALASYERLGVELEATAKYIARHDQVGATAGLLPAARTAVVADRAAFKIALADLNELRAEWLRGLAPELHAVGCTDKLLAAAIADPLRYQRIVDDVPTPPPAHTAPRALPRATFVVDNTDCPDPVDVWLDGAPLGQVAPGHRTALVGEGGERTLCLQLPGAPACGDRGTVREVYLHDGWSVTMHCPKN